MTEWLTDHTEVIALAIYVVINIIPRKPPADPRWRIAWRAVEILCVLSWDRWGGSLKALGTVRPHDER
jgi:hypothetical protein